MTEPKQYSQEAEQVLDVAVANARQLGHSHISSEHLLLAVLALGEGIGAPILANAGLIAEQVGEYLAKVGLTEERNSRGWGESGQRILALAAKHAINLQHPKIEPEHLALALLDEPCSTKVLQHFGIDIENTRKLIFDRISHPAP